MHLTWRDFERISRKDILSWRCFTRYPHLLFCAKCRKELKTHAGDKMFVAKIKSAYARCENIHTIMASKGSVT